MISNERWANWVYFLAGLVHIACGLGAVFTMGYWLPDWDFYYWKWVMDREDRRVK